MNTAVQLRPISARALPRSNLVCGEPHAIIPGELGPIALFRPGELVAYRLGRLHKRRLYVFRTLDVADRFAAAVPGVRPGVRLLLALRSPGRVKLAQRLLSYLANAGRDPNALPDAFYLRVAAALSGRPPALKILLSLLNCACSPRAEPQRRTQLAQLPTPHKVAVSCGPGGLL
jgi:hypothetical protein